MSVDDPRVLVGLQLLRERQWYAAHESIEAAWLEAEGVERAFLQGLTQVAVSFEHLRRGNPRGAQSQWRKALPKLLLPESAASGFDVVAWCAEISRFFAQIDLAGRALAQRSGTQVAALPDEVCWPVPGPLS